MATMATLIHPRDAYAQKKPINPSTATVYRRGSRHEPATNETSFNVVLLLVQYFKMNIAAL